MEDYENPEMLEEIDLGSWSKKEVFDWCHGGGQYAVLTILTDLHIEKNRQAFNLGKHIWYNGGDEDEIKDQIQKYAQSIA